MYCPPCSATTTHPFNTLSQLEGFHGSFIVQLRYSSGCSWVLGRHILPFDWFLWNGLDAPNHVE